MNPKKRNFFYFRSAKNSNTKIQDNTLVCSLEDPKHSDTKIQNQASCIFWLSLFEPIWFFISEAAKKKSGTK